jgi:hypothetical protein
VVVPVKLAPPSLETLTTMSLLQPFRSPTPVYRFRPVVAEKPAGVQLPLVGLECRLM